ncbi:MAG: hypothetical protein KDB07_06775, partial [Planctomycetes bacterium]|nr:hypothetical protein [Planctomycetota bacterium]
MGSPAHDAPPPPGREFVLYLLTIVVIGLAVGYFIISPLAGENAIFVYGLIAFVAPLIGWGVTVSFGKYMWRQGDFLPVTMLLISFLCGASIFKTVIIQNYDTGFAREWRFNWFNVSGDDAVGAKGALKLSDDEYAQLGFDKMVAHARGANASPSGDAESVVADAKLLWQRADRPDLDSFDAGSPEALAQFKGLFESVQLEVELWVLRAKLSERVAIEARQAKLDRLKGELAAADMARRKDAISKRIEAIEAAEIEAPFALRDFERELLAKAISGFEHTLEGYKKRHGTKVSGGESSYEAPSKAIESVSASLAAFEVETPATSEGAEATSATGLGWAFASAEQGLLDWRYSALDPYFNKELKTKFEDKPEFLAHAVDLRTAQDPHFQAFAVGIYIDNVTAITLAMVTLLAFLIHLFSIGYMYGEIRYGRFMATINLFTAGMIGLVLANNFLWLFVCWEIMGLCSYLLIGHYFEKKSAQEASMKAFFTTRIADTFMFLGMMMIFAYTGTFLFAGSADANAAMQA